MKPNSNKEAQRWLSQAERDIDDAKYTEEGRRFNLTCFLAQQSAEKALKAYLYAQNAEEIWGHSVSELCTDAEGFDSTFGKLKKKAASLDKYYIPTRYPNGLPGGIPADVYQEEDAKMALLLANKVIEFVKRKI